MKRYLIFAPIIVAVFYFAFVAQKLGAQQLLLGSKVGGQPNASPTATPSPTPTPGPTPNVEPGANLVTTISGGTTGQQFILDNGVYHMWRDDGGSTAPMALLTNQLIVGVGAFSGLPSSPPTAVILGSGVIPTDSADNAWHAATVGGHSLWYNTIGNSLSLNLTGGLAHGCMLPGGGVSTSASQQKFWTASTTEAAAANITDSNGNTEHTTAGGTTGATPPATWATSSGGTTADGTVTWTLTGLYADVSWPSSAGPSPVGVAGCVYHQDLWYATTESNPSTWVPKHHALAWQAGNIGVSSYFIDFEGVGGHGKFTLWVSDDPTGKTVELAEIKQAVRTGSNGVTVQNLSFAGFAASNGTAVIEPDGTGELIQSNWVTHSHGEGIKPINLTGGGLANPQSVTIDSNEVIEMGQSGINTGGGTMTTVSNNKLERNNVDGHAYGDEAGATKFAADSGDSITGNTISCSNGNGGWSDNGETSTTWNNNTFTHNLWNGLTYEISFSGTITNNTFTANAQQNSCQCVANHFPLLNGQDLCTGAQTASGAATCQAAKYEIWVHSSSTTTVGSSGNGNTITSNCAGIQVVDENRIAGGDTGNTVSYNTLTLHTGSAVINSILGGQNTSTTNMFNASPANAFDHDTYHFDNSTSLAAKQWQWGSGGSCTGATNTTYAFSSLQSACSQEVHGSAVTP
jgi:hypothetical protein